MVHFGDVVEFILMTCYRYSCKHLDLLSCLAQKSELVDECLVFTNQPSDSRPKIWYNGKNVRVYIAIYNYLWGNVPSGLSVLHHCDNSRCWEPNHLYADTQKQNMLDRAIRNPDSFPNISRNFKVGLLEGING